jgi:hypothetical protein
MSDVENDTTVESKVGRPIESFSFACGGWLFIYMFGVAKCLQDRGVDKKLKCAAGCSAGALTAAGLCLGGDFDKATEFCREECVSRAYGSFFGIFKIAQYVSECLDVSIDLNKGAMLPEGKLQVAYSVIPFMKPERATSFTSGEDLKKCLLASSAAFPLAPLVQHRGNWLVDGGYTDFQPEINEDTITVSPLYFSNADIRPSRYVPLWWAMLPPSCEGTVDWLFELGYKDTTKWLNDNGWGVTITATDGIDTTAEHQSDGPKILPQKVLSDPAADSKCPQHPFHTPRRVSVHRFLGFDVAALTHRYVAAVMDLTLYIWLMFVWRPLAVSLIYTELCFFLTMYILGTLFKEVYDNFPVFCCVLAIFTPSFWAVYLCLFLMLRSKVIVISPKRTKRLEVLWEHVLCLFSLSLFSRYLPSGTPSANPIRKNEHLSNHSIMYRIVRHFI